MPSDPASEDERATRAALERALAALGERAATGPASAADASWATGRPASRGRDQDEGWPDEWEAATDEEPLSQRSPNVRGRPRASLPADDNDYRAAGRPRFSESDAPLSDDDGFRPAGRAPFADGDDDADWPASTDGAPKTRLSKATVDETATELDIIARVQRRRTRTILAVIGGCIAALLVVGGVFRLRREGIDAHLRHTKSTVEAPSFAAPPSLVPGPPPSAAPPAAPASFVGALPEEEIDPAEAVALHEILTPPPGTVHDPTMSKQRALEAITRGNFREGMAESRVAISTDPTDADCYLLLGAAMQELGQWKQATLVFRECSRRANHGEVWECQALSRR